MNQLKSTRFLNALLRQPVDCTPVWIMRQAGRYLPEYRQLRQKAGSFLMLCKTPELACEVTLQPLARFDLDAAILFSDILTIPDAMGLGLYFAEGEGPKFKKPVRSPADIAALGVPDPEETLSYVTDAVRIIKHELAGRVPLIGFSGSPWTLATYMVEGGSSKDFRVIKALMYREPQALQQLLATLSEAVTQYLSAQINAGVQAVQIFDTWGGVLTPKNYETFSLNPMATIVAKLKQTHPEVPIILFTKNGGAWLEKMAQTGCDALGVDWTIDIGVARQRVGTQVAIQGNMDPGVLYATPEHIRAEVKNILTSFGSGNGHVFNLGHGITQDVPPEHVQVLVEAVHEFSAVK